MGKVDRISESKIKKLKRITAYINLMKFKNRKNIIEIQFKVQTEDSIFQYEKETKILSVINNVNFAE